MNETELERIVVRLIGDGSSYQKMMTTAAEQTVRASNVIGAAAAKIEGFKNSLVSFGSQALGALGMFGVVSSLRSAFEASQKLEEGQIRLRNTIQATGQDVATVTAQFAALADNIAKTTLTTKGEVFSLAQRTTMMGLNAAASERVIRNSLAMAAVSQQEPASMLRAAAAMERGNYQLAQRMLLGRGVKLSDEELHKVINNMLNAGLKIQAELANTASGKMERLGRSLKSITMEIGGMVTTVIGPTVERIKELVDWFNALDPATKKATAGIVGLTLAINPLVTSIRMFTTVMVGWPGLLAAATGGAVLLWARWKYGADEALKSSQNLWDGIRESAEEWVNYFKYAMNNFDSEWERFKVRGQLALAIVLSVALNTWEKLKLGFGTAWAQVVNLATQGWEMTTGGIRLMWEDTTTWIAQKLHESMTGYQMLATQVGGFMLGWTQEQIDEQLDILRQQHQNTLDDMAEQRDIANDQTVQRGQAAMQAARENMERVQRELSEAYANNLDAMDPIIAALERNLAELDQDFQNRFLAFNIDQARARRMRQQAAQAGNGVGNAFAEGAKKGIESVENVLTFSAEAITRLAAYRNNILNVSRNPSGGGSAVGNRPTPAGVAALIGGGAGGGTAVLGVLGQIANNTRVAAQRPPVQINQANLEEQ